jgi:hypothetical protein
VGAFRLELGDHDDRQNHLMLIEPSECTRVGQQDRGVEDEGAAVIRRPPTRGCH